MYRNADADAKIWSVSTIKLAIAVDLLVRNRTGAIKLTPEDQNRMTARETAALVNEMKRVDTDQRWRVWGAGRAMAPGNKNGWSVEQGGWVVISVGFAGPSQRYTLAVMNALGDAGGYRDSVATTTRLAELLLS